MKFPGKRARISVALTLLLALFAAVPVLEHYLFRYEWARSTQEDLENRHARLLGLNAAAEPIATALRQARETLARFAYPASAGTDRVGADLQQRVRLLAQESGVAVAGSQILPAREAEGLEVIRLALTLEAEPGPLRDLLTAIDSEQPSIQIESMALTMPRQRAGRTGNRVRVQLQLNTMRLGA